jgi:thiol-disulfide isomerase/thioredoxin
VHQLIASALVRAVTCTALAAATAGCSAGETRTAVPSVSAQNAVEASLLPTAADALPSFGFDEFQALGTQLNGVPVVVNIWSSWCGPCKTEAPVLAAASRRHGSEVQFVGVDILDDRGAAADAIRKSGWRFPSVFDPKGEIRNRLGFVGQPETLFYDASGSLDSTWIGTITREEIEKRIAAIASGA